MPTSRQSVGTSIRTEVEAKLTLEVHGASLELKAKAEAETPLATTKEIMGQYPKTRRLDRSGRRCKTIPNLIECIVRGLGITNAMISIITGGGSLITGASQRPMPTSRQSVGTSIRTEVEAKLTLEVHGASLELKAIHPFT